MAKKVVLNSFHPQAYLMYLVSSSDKSIRRSKLTPGTQTTGVHMLKGLYQPEAVMSKVYNTKDTTGKNLIKKHFFNLETHKITALVPELRFYKAHGGKLTPFFFPVSAIADEAATTQGHSRVKASGVKTFSVKTMGTNPYEAPRFLEADLTLYVENLANLFDVEPGYAPLADLFTISIARSARKKGKGGSTLTSSDFIRPIEVAATLGYTTPDPSIFTQEEIREIRDSNLDIRMNVYHHSIDVRQDGSALISIRYTARINNAGRDLMFSATDQPIDLLKRANIKQMLSPQKKKISALEKKEKETPETIYRSQIERMAEIRKILEILEREKKIYSKTTTRQSLEDYKKLGASVTGEDKTPKTLSLADPPKNAIDNSKAFEEALKKVDNSVRKVYYITFGDLVQAFFQKVRTSLEKSKRLLDNASSFLDNKQLGLSDKELEEVKEFAKKSEDEKIRVKKETDERIERLKTFKVYLPDIEYKFYKADGVDGVSDEIRRINLSDVPVSLETYQSFMFDKVMNSYMNSYTIPQFLGDCIRDLLPMAFGQRWSKVGIAPRLISAIPKFTSTTFSAPRLRGSLSRSPEIEAEEAPSPQKSFRNSTADDICDYYIIYQHVDRELSADRSGDQDQDSRDGIYHFEIGKNRGLTKSISFKRFEVPGAQEQLMTNQVGLYDELKLPYSADISMFGNNLFIPGSQIYINPSNIGFGLPTNRESPAFKIGLGGYYTVLSTTTTFTDGVLATELECTFGSHASDTIGLSGEKKKEKSLDSLGPTEASRDDTAISIPDLDTSNVLVAQSHYLQQLQTLTDPETGERVLEAPLARMISNDYILHQDASLIAIPGVLDKSINSQTGAIRYNLDTGKSIEIDDTADANQAVRLVKSSPTSLYSAYRSKNSERNR